MIEARALVCVLLLAAILTILFALSAHGADVVTQCSATRERDNSYWSYREIDGRRCWYRGQPGRSKSLLRWALSSPRSSAETGRPETTQVPSKQLAESQADPVVEPTSTEEPTWQATMEDQLLAFTCCWPELEPSRMLNKIQDRVTELPLASPPVQPLWPIICLPIAVIAALAILLARRRLM